MTSEKSLLYALGVSVLVHAGVLTLGVPGHGRPVDAPRLLEARLLKPESPPAPDIKPAAPPAPLPVPPPKQHVKPVDVARKTPLVAPKQPIAPVLAQRLVRAAEPEQAVPAVASAPEPAPPAATSGRVAAPAAPAAVSAGAANSAGNGAYSPPSYGASYLHNPKPGYPLIARRRGLEGLVKLDVRVSVEGLPVSVKVREGSGHDSLDEAALNAVWHWRFVPAKRGGEAVEASFVVPIRFELNREETG